MKSLLLRYGHKACMTVLVMFFFQAIAFAQDTKVQINGNDVGSWFANNWIWVTGLIAFLIIVLLFSISSSKRSRSKTTVYRNHDGKVVQTTTTETETD